MILLKVISYKSNIPNLEIFIDENDIVVIFKDKFECLSNAAINGGRLKSDSIVNHHVLLDFNHQKLDKIFDPVKKKFNLSNSTIGLLTAVEMKDAVIINDKVNNIDYTIVLTAGLTNTCAPNVEDLDKIEEINNIPGTINIILIINGRLTEHAIVNLFIIMTEAKTLLLNKLDVRTSNGSLATGTSTDTIVVGFSNQGQLVEWSGYATEFGQSVGRSVFKTLDIALREKISYR